MKLNFGILACLMVLGTACDDDDGITEGTSAGDSSGGTSMGETGHDEGSTSSDGSSSGGSESAGSSSGGSESSGSSSGGTVSCEGLPCGANCSGPGGDPVILTCDADGACNLGGEDTCQSCAELGCGEPCAENLELGFCDAERTCDVSLTEPPFCE